ncbi:MAG: transposase [Gemmataceae bacterium]|nr:transposase [Gemmataceae bacterium]
MGVGDRAGGYGGKDRTPVIEDREKAVARIEHAPTPDLTARRLADEYTGRMLRKAEAGRGSHGNYGQAKAALDPFVNYFGAARSLEHLSEKAVRDDTEHLEGLIGSDALSRNTAHRYQQQFRTWIDALVGNYPDDIPRPKNLCSKSQPIPKQRKEPDPLTVEEVGLLPKHAVPRTRLFLPLMLNCGMYQGDIADLTPAEIDRQAGRIVRPRSQTKRQAETTGTTQPVKVNWLLWRTTWELFQQFAHRGGFCLRYSGPRKRGRQCSYSGGPRRWSRWERRCRTPPTGRPAGTCRTRHRRPGRRGRRPRRTARYGGVFPRGYESVPAWERGLRAYFTFYNEVRRHQSLGSTTPAGVYRAGRSKGPARE